MFDILRLGMVRGDFDVLWPGCWVGYINPPLLHFFHTHRDLLHSQNNLADDL